MPWDNLLSRRKHRTTHKWEVWDNSFSLSGWTLSKTFGPLDQGYPCSEDEELFLDLVSNSYLGEDVNEMQMFKNIKTYLVALLSLGRKSVKSLIPVFYLSCLLRGFRDKNIKPYLRRLDKFFWVELFLFHSIIVEWKTTALNQIKGCQTMCCESILIKRTVLL